MSKRSVAHVIRISPPQQQFITSKFWMTGFTGGRGAGKTVAGSLWCYWGATDGSNIMAVSPTYQIAAETTFKTFVELVESQGAIIKTREHPTPFCKFRTLDGGVAEIAFKSADKPDSLVGRSVSALWFDEASLTVREAFERALGCARHRGEMGVVAATFTPRGFNHWTFEQFYEYVEHPEEHPQRSKLVQFNEKWYLPKPNTQLIHCPSSQNPFLAQEYVPQISQNYSNRLKLQELEGMFLEIEGLMFARKHAEHVESVPIEAERVRYIDKASSVGERACYSAMALVARTPDGLWYIEDMVRGRWSAYERNKIIGQTLETDYRRYNGSVLTYIEQEGAGSAKDVNEELIRRFSKYPIYTDLSTASAMQTVNGVLLPGDVKVRRASPFAAQWEAGNVRIKRAEWNGDFLDELCVREDTRIRLQGTARSRIIELPIRDLHDVWRDNPDILVRTRNGGRRIKHIQCTGKKAIWILSTGGRELFATRKHPIWCVNQNRWVPLYLLAPGDRVLVINSCRNIEREIVSLVAYTGQSKHVWNMEVEEDNEYFANGLLTHNCMFPEFKFCDQVDAVAAGVNKISSTICDYGQSATRYNGAFPDRQQNGSALYLPKSDRGFVDPFADRDFRASKLPWL